MMHRFAPRYALRAACARYPRAAAAAPQWVRYAGTAAAQGKAKGAKAKPAKAKAPSDGKHVFIWDVETTGLSSENDQIIEIGIFHPHSGETFERLVKPTVAEMKEAAQEVHGIDMSELADKPGFQAVWADAMEWTAGRCPESEKKLFLSHFTHSLDTPLLHKELGRFDATLPANIILADSATMIRSNMPKNASLSLDNLVAHFELCPTTGAAHRALGDTKRIWTIFNMLKPEGTLQHVSSVYKLAALEQKAKEKAAKPRSRGANWWKWVKKKEPKTDAAPVTAASA